MIAVVKIEHMVSFVTIRLLENKKPTAVKLVLPVVLIILDPIHYGEIHSSISLAGVTFRTQNFL